MIGGNDPLGRIYTPDSLAQAIAIRLATRPYIPARAHWVDPCSGGGAFLRAFAHPDVHRDTLHIHGIDVDPECDSVKYRNAKLGNCLDRSIWPCGDLIVATNPPFGKAVDKELTRGIIERSREEAKVIAMLLPLAYFGQAKWQKQLLYCSELWPINGRPFTNDREMAVYVWIKPALAWQKGKMTIEPIEWK